MAEQRFCKPDRDENPLVILNGYKGVLVVSLGDGGWRKVLKSPSRARRWAQHCSLVAQHHCPMVTHGEADAQRMLGHASR
jgi:hypothetical protein